MANAEDLSPKLEQEKDIKPNISPTGNERKKEVARAKLSILGSSNQQGRRQSVGPRKRKRNAQYKPNDQRKCEHSGQFLVWQAQGSKHKWEGKKDMSEDPNKEQAVRNIVYSFGKQTAEHIHVRQYLTWNNDWRAAAQNGGILVDRRVRMFKDPEFTFVVANHIPYAKFSVNGKYFKENIVAGDFVQFSNDNPAFKNRLSAFVANVVCEHMCHTCPFYIRTDIGQADDRKYKIPFLKVSLTCKRPECNLRFTAIFKTSKLSADGKLMFEIFSERFRTLSVLANNSNADNATKTFVAGSCGRCIVSQYVDLLDDVEPTSEEEISKYVRPSKRDAFLNKGRTNQEIPFDNSVTAFDILHTVIRFKNDLFAHKDNSSTELINDIAKTLGMGDMDGVTIYKFVEDTFRELGFGGGSIPFLDKLVYDSLDDEFKQVHDRDLTKLMQSFYDFIKSAHPNINWPIPIKGRKPAVKEEAEESDSDDDVVSRSAITQQEDDESYELVAEHNLTGYIRVNEEPSPQHTAQIVRPTERALQMDEDIAADDDIVFETPISRGSGGLDGNASAIVKENPHAQELLDQALTDPKQEPTEESPEPKRSCFDVSASPIEIGDEQNPDAEQTVPLPSIFPEPISKVGRLVRPSSAAEILQTPLNRLMIPAAAFQNKTGESVIAASDLLIFQED